MNRISVSFGGLWDKLAIPGHFCPLNLFHFSSVSQQPPASGLYVCVCSVCVCVGCSNTFSELILYKIVHVSPLQVMWRFAGGSYMCLDHGRSSGGVILLILMFFFSRVAQPPVGMHASVRGEWPFLNPATMPVRVWLLPLPLPNVQHSCCF